MTREPDRGEPSPWVLRFAHLISPGGEVLDLASGHGRHARWFSARGFRVTALDRDAKALADCTGASIICADLEVGSDLLAGRHFDCVLVTNYLYRPLFPLIVDWLAPEGVLLYETFTEGQAAYGRPRNPAFLLRPQELLQAFAQLSIVAFEEGVVLEPEARAVQRLCARKHARLCALSGSTAALPGVPLSPSQIR